MSERKRDFLSFWDLSEGGDGSIEALIGRAEELRALRAAGTPHATRPGRVLGMVFEKASTRTRASFEIAMFDLGGHGLYLGMQGSQLERGEPLRDTARVLSGYCHGIMLRTFGHQRAEEMARYATVPVINGLTDLLHPCQVLADLQTVAQKIAPGVRDAKQIGAALRSVKYAWIGDGNNMANSWIEAAGILGLDLALACPPGYVPDEAVLTRARATERGRITVTSDPATAAAGRQVLSTDVFASMGQEAEAEQRRKAFAGYCIDAPLLAKAAADAMVLHCLPAHRGEEITDEVIEGPASAVWRQAENRLHAQKALVELVIP
jgi:ornithine carbamoyltransferase